MSVAAAAGFKGRLIVAILFYLVLAGVIWDVARTTLQTQL
jgi:hypothetical protein